MISCVIVTVFFLFSSILARTWEILVSLVQGAVNQVFECKTPFLFFNTFNQPCHRMSSNYPNTTRVMILIIALLLLLRKVWGVWYTFNEHMKTLPNTRTNQCLHPRMVRNNIAIHKALSLQNRIMTGSCIGPQ